MKFIAFFFDFLQHFAHSQKCAFYIIKTVIFFFFVIVFISIQIRLSSCHSRREHIVSHFFVLILFLVYRIWSRVARTRSFTLWSTISISFFRVHFLFSSQLSLPRSWLVMNVHFSRASEIWIWSGSRTNDTTNEFIFFVLMHLSQCFYVIAWKRRCELNI